MCDRGSRATILRGVKGPGVTIVLATAALAAAAGACAGSPPTVYTQYPNGSFYKTCTKYTVNNKVVRQCYGPSPLAVRPKTISQSEDGNGFLSNLDWTSWTASAASATGLMAVRCFGGSTDPNCYRGRFDYQVPVHVRLSTPVSTSRGRVFTVMAITRPGARTQILCLPPAAAC